MKYRGDEEGLDLRKEYLKNQVLIKELSESLQKELNEMQKIEETSARLEKTINVQVADIRSIEKSNVSIKSKIEQKRLVNEPEKNQIKDLDGFVKASRSIFTANIFAGLENDSHKQEILQGRSGEVLLEIAKISEMVSALKANIFDLKRAEVELKDIKYVDKQRKVKELTAEIKIYEEKTVKVRYKNVLGREEICDFPMTDHLGNKIKFAQLLENACRYWDLVEYGNVLMDENLLVWPSSKNVIDELSDSSKQVWIMTREEAHYFKAVKSKEKSENNEKNEESPESLESSSRKYSLSDEIDDELSKKAEALLKDKEKIEKDILKTQTRNHNVLNLLIYGVFLVGFTWSLNQSNQVEKTYEVGNGISNPLFTTNFPVNSTSQTYFGGINLKQDLENFMMGPLATTLFSSTDYNGNPLTSTEQNYVKGLYKKIGPTRFLQKKSIMQECLNNFSSNLGRSGFVCFEDLSSANEYTQTLSISNFPSEYSSWLEYTRIYNPRTVTGLLNSYDLQGYIAYISANTSYVDALAQIDFIVTQWVDLQTRVLVIDSNFCNYNSDMCVSVNILFEFSAGGGVLPKSQVVSYRVNLTWTFDDKIRIAFDCVVAVIMLYFLSDFIKKVRAQGAKTAFLNFWNLLLLLMAAMLFSKHMAYIAYQEKSEIKYFREDSTEFIDYMSVAILYKMIANFTGVSSFIAYYYVMAFFQDSKSLQVIWGTLGQSAYRLLFFFFVFLLVFLGWMLLAYKGFGEYLYDYSNLGNTASTLLQMLLGNINFQEIYNVQPEFAGLFFFLFIFFDYFIMLNIFLAIINEAYDTIYKKAKSNDEEDEMILIIKTLLSGAKYSFINIPKKVILCKYCKKKKVKKVKILASESASEE